MTAKRAQRKAGKRGAKDKAPAKKRPPVSSEPVSADELEEARGLLHAARALLSWYGQDLESPPNAGSGCVDFRTNIRFVAEFVEQANGGKLYERNRRWAVLYFTTRDERNQRARPTAAVVAHWDGLPREYAASSKEAVRARELIASSVAARSRYEWLELLVEAIRSVEAAGMVGCDWSPTAFEATVLAHDRVERRVLGVTNDD